MSKNNPVIAKAYAVHEEFEEVASETAAVLPAYVDQPVHVGDPTIVPELGAVAWTDDFFEDDDDIVAVFDQDFQKVQGYYESIGWVSYGSTCCFCPSLFWFGVLCGVPCYLKQNVQWSIRSQHVALTVTGVKIVHERHRTCWGLPCTDVPRRTNFIPYSDIIACRVEEPRGTTCIFEHNFHAVHIETRQEEYTINGINEPWRFRDTLLSMRRQMPVRQQMRDEDTTTLRTFEYASAPVEESTAV